MKKYKLRCFWCGKNFNSKEEVIRTNGGEPVCEECLSTPMESDDYEDEWIDDPEWDIPEW